MKSGRQRERQRQRGGGGGEKFSLFRRGGNKISFFSQHELTDGCPLLTWPSHSSFIYLLLTALSPSFWMPLHPPALPLLLPPSL